MPWNLLLHDWWEVQETLISQSGYVSFTTNSTGRHIDCFMADNFLEKHREEYEQRKARYMSHGSHLSKKIKEMIAKKKAENKTTS